MLALLYNAMPDYQTGNAFYNKNEARTGRLFLENVAAALAPGTFYLAKNCSATYKHCGERRGHTLFYWPLDGSARSAPVIQSQRQSAERIGSRVHLLDSNAKARGQDQLHGG